MVAHRHEGECPCGTGELYAQCCGPLHARERRAQTPEQLMRSRYSAFFLLDTEYLRLTWAPEATPQDLTLDAQQKWTRLRVLDAPEPEGNEGYVHYRAHFRYGNLRDFLEEVSRFERRDGVWLYVDGEILE